MVGDREVLGLMLLTNAEAVASVLRGTASDAYSPLAALGATRTLALVIEDTMRALVAQARSEGSTWQDIGDVLGTTRQAAYQRFGSMNTEEVLMETPLEGADTKAAETIDRYTKQDWSLRAEFDANMRERLTEDLLASGWSQVTAALGAFKKRGKPTSRVIQDHTVVDVPMTFENGEMKGRVAFDGDGKIAGLFILNLAVA